MNKKLDKPVSICYIVGMENENKLKGLVLFLNTVFDKAKYDYKASIDTDNECVVVSHTRGIDYEVFPVEKGWELFGMVCIPQTRETPEDFDVESLVIVNHAHDVFRAIVLHEMNDKIDGWIENASLELNPDDGGLF